MAFCRKCGNKLADGAKFCGKCGTPVVSTAPVANAEATAPDNSTLPAAPAEAAIPVAISLSVDKPDYYLGEKRSFIVNGESIDFDAPLDAHIYYRRHFTRIARELSAKFYGEYTREVKNVDDFLIKLPSLYQKYRVPIFEVIGQLLIDAEIYDVSVEQIAEQINNSQLRINEYYTKMVNDFNATIEYNQQKRARNWNMLPTMIFSGIGGFVLGTALNFAVTNVAEESIRKANVSYAQRVELFNRVRPEDIYKAVYDDYLGMYVYLLGALRSHGKLIWMDMGVSEQEKGIYQNLIYNRIPFEKQKEKKLDLIRINPINAAYCALIENENDPDMAPLIEYIKC